MIHAPTRLPSPAAAIKLLLLLTILCASARGADVAAQLGALRAEMQNASDAEKAEPKALALIDKGISFAECGEVYAAIAFMHSDKGIIHPEKVIEYGEKALLFPIAPLTISAVRLRVIDAKLIAFNSTRGPTLLGARREIVMRCLVGMAYAGKSLECFASVPVPAVSKYDIAPAAATDAASKAIIARHEQELSARNAAMLHNQALEYFDMFVAKCVDQIKQLNLSAEEI